MVSVSAKQLRLQLTEYLDRLEKGESFVIIRHSYVIGRLVPGPPPEPEEDADKTLRVEDNKRVIFRRLSRYEDSMAIVELHKAAMEPTGTYVNDPSLDRDLNGPASYYESYGGQFWVGEQDGELVAMGAFMWNLGDKDEVAVIKRMRVSPDMQGQGIGGKLLELLEAEAQKAGYKEIQLDTIAGTAAQTFYENRGYIQFKQKETKVGTQLFYKKALA